MLRLPAQAGSPALTLGLAVSATAWYLILTLSGSVSPGWEAADLGSFRLWAVLLLLNLSAGAADALRQGAQGLRLCFCLAALLVLFSGAYVYLFRFEGVVGLAEGEAYEPVPAMFSAMDKGPLASIPALSFTVTRVDPDHAAGRVEIVRQGVRSEAGTRWERIGESDLRYLRSRLAPLVTVTGRDKGELERSYVKLDLEPPGKEESFMFGTLPYEFYLRKDRPGKAGAKPSFHLNVRRGKLSLFDGPLAVGRKAPVQGVEVAILEERKFAMLEIRSRRGHAVFMAALGLLALVVAAAVTVRAKGDPRGA